METTIVATPHTISNGLWVGAIIFAVFLVVALFLGLRSEKLTKAHPSGTQAHSRGETYFLFAVCLAFLGMLAGLGVSLGMEGTQRDTVRDSIVATIEEENGLKDLVRGDDSRAHSIERCVDGDELVVEDYMWSNLDDTSPTLTMGKIVKSAEQDGSCVYTVFAEQTLP